MGEPTLVLQAPNLTVTAPVVLTNFERAMKLFADKGIRKRFMVVNFSQGPYIIGGYEYLASTRQRRPPTHDYFYDSKQDALVPIEPLPDGRVSFAVCTDGRYIVCAGGER